MRSVRLKPEAEQKLARVSRITGQTISAVIQEAVDKHCADVLAVQTADVLLADYIGCLSVGEPVDARTVKEEFGAYVEDKLTRGTR